MAFTLSGGYVLNEIDVYDATQLAIDLSLTSHKDALYLTAKTPNFSSDVGYSATNEASGTGYTAGGKAVTGLNPTVTESPTGTWKYDSDDQSWTGSTISSAVGNIRYADALAGKNNIVAQAFGGSFSTTSGTFTKQEPAGGLIASDITP